MEGDAGAFPEAVPRLLKGLVFVQPYAVYEHCIVAGVQVALRQVNASGLILRELRPELLSIVLDNRLIGRISEIVELRNGIAHGSNAS
jgi:hypothetical protein